MRNDKLALGAFLYATGHHIAGWRHPASDALSGHRLKTSVEVTQALERAKFDFAFLSDRMGMREGDIKALSRSSRGSHFEAITHAAALAAVTSHIGLIATATTTFHEPYNIARQFGSLDHLSGGRAGWNVVTSASDVEGGNYGLETMALHGDRYSRAEEFVDVVTGLWNTWDDGALAADKASGVFFDATGVRPLDHKGEYYSVRGPLNMARSPQGHPVIVQAGASDDGRRLGARVGEIIFSASQTLKEAQEYYSDMKQRAQAFGRQRDDLKIMPGINPIVGRDEAEARAKFEQLQSLIDPAVGLQLLAQMIGNADILKHDIDGPIPELPETNAIQSRQRLVIDLARREGLSIRQLSLRIAGARGHAQVVGTPAQVVDEMEERFMAFGADGFNIMPATLPGGADDFLTLVMPELQRRDLCRTEYNDTTLRGNVGCRPPPANFA